MGWIFLAVSEESQKPLKDTLPLSLTVKMTDTLKRYSYHEWQQEICPLLQYGATLPRSEVPTYQGSILSTEDFPAKTFQLQDAEWAWAESVADYSLRSSGSSAKYDPDSSSWRTSQQLLFEEQSELLGSFAAYGMTVDGEFFPLKMWARITDAKDGGYWPTPSTMDHIQRKGMRPSRAATGRITGYLSEAPSIVGGQLNPTWVEWLMGYPFEWTVLEDWVTPWYQPKRGKRLKG